MSIIEVKNISVCYVVGDLKNIGLKEYIVQNISGKYQVSNFLANKDINFSLEHGDMMAIIGTNGAGKSTLLKAVSGVMKPSSGSIKISGRIAALLELASGFDGELTVKENTYLRGAMLGYTRRFMDEQYENIISFAELGEFQNRPFKQLSSGMKSRLAFSIASLVKPDIIILDEVLSVGDGSFKEKSAAKMKEILASGVTGILVSHSMAQVRQMCNKVLWLDHGRQIGFSNDVETYCGAYEEFLKTGEVPSNQSDIMALYNRKKNRLLEEESKRKKKREEQNKLTVQKEQAFITLREESRLEIERLKDEVEKYKQEAAQANADLQQLVGKASVSSNEIIRLEKLIQQKDEWLVKVKENALREKENLKSAIKTREEWLEAVKLNAANVKENLTRTIRTREEWLEAVKKNATKEKQRLEEIIKNKDEEIDALKVEKETHENG